LVTCPVALYPAATDADTVRVDRCKEALRALIDEKNKGWPVRTVKPANDDDEVIDPLDALRKNLKGSGVSRERAERFTDAKTRNGKKPGTRRRAA
jgi:DNA end-binding protein Ku